MCKWLSFCTLCTIIFVPKAHNHKFNRISILHYWLQSINKINLLLDAKHDEKELAFEGEKRGENIFLLYNNWKHIEDKVYWLLEIIASWYLILPFEAMGFKDQIASFDKSFLFKYKQKKKHFPITFMYIFPSLRASMSHGNILFILSNMKWVDEWYTNHNSSIWNRLKFNDTFV